MNAEALVHRVRGEYYEMPGLRLTLAQACRLWQVDRATCEAVLDRLVHDRVLFRTLDSHYIALPTPRSATAARTVAKLAS